MTMRAFACCSLLCCVALLGAADWNPTEALLTMRSGRQTPYFVSLVTVDKVVAAQGASGPEAQIPFNNIRDIEWTGLRNHIPYAKALGDMGSGEFDKAIENFEKVAKARIQVFAIKGREGLADAYAAKGDHAKAVSMLDEIIAEHGKWPWLPDIVYRKGQLQMEAGNLDAAEQTFASLAGMAATFGPKAESSSLLGRAQVRVARQDSAGAAALLAQAFEKASVETDPGLRGRIGLLLAAQQQEAGQADAALATLEQIKFLPLPGDDLARVHARLGAMLLGRGELRRAFDHAVLGTVVSEVGDAARSEARGVARRVRAAIEESGDFSNQEKLAYREAYEKL